ncbi:MAG: NTPase [Candidatus Methanogaster sp.]|uniref:NTPase n=1 Tax=Candidatus Methanogaster sp. TaxID=3386292 RepID=A0AC61L644_9EURY|nr:MAG: NTPase [ANME-2 cluster archaeon]
MRTRVAITGQPGVGKTTVCMAVVDRLGRSTGGMVCSDITEGAGENGDSRGRRVGFELLDLQTRVKGVLAHIRGDGPRVGKYHVNMSDLDRIGVSAILSAVGTDLIVIDEIAPMELMSQRFIRAVEEALASDRDMLVVLHQRSAHPLAERIRAEFDLITVTKDNRDMIADEIVRRFDPL